MHWAAAATLTTLTRAKAANDIQPWSQSVIAANWQAGVCQLTVVPANLPMQFGTGQSTSRASIDHLARSYLLSKLVFGKTLPI